MFIRIKKIAGQQYAYLVKNTWTEKRPRQKVVNYLGKIVYIDDIEKKKAVPTQPITEPEFEKFINKPLEQYLAESNSKTIISDAIKAELVRKGFAQNTQKNELISKGRIKINLEEGSVLSGKTRSVVRLNEGYLCNYTLKNVLSYKLKDNKADDEIGYDLAMTFSNAGITIPKRVFIAVFEKMMQKQ